jgi:hypothetical protein
MNLKPNFAPRLYISFDWYGLPVYFFVHERLQCSILFFFVMLPVGLSSMVATCFDNRSSPRWGVERWRSIT